jgi:Fe2+ or Zn2+ uptake regulation protein
MSDQTATDLQAPAPPIDPGRGRRALIAALTDASEPLTLRQIRQAVRDRDPDVAPSSLDDQLDVLIAERRVAEINFGRAFELRRTAD